MEDNMKDMFKNIENLDINSKDFEEIKPQTYMYEPTLKKEWLYTDTKPVLAKKKNKVKKLKDKFKELIVVIGLKIAGKNIDDLI